MMQNILIVGTGALATLFAGRLAQVGANICMLGSWQTAIQALNDQGARLYQADGTCLAVPVRATADVTECGPIDLALVLVKAWQTPRAAIQLEQCLPTHALAVTLQNGLGNRELLAERLGDARVLQAVSTTGATLLGPGLVRMGGDGLISLQTHPRSAALAAVLQRAGFRVELVQDLLVLQWSKLVINAAINPLTALLGLPNGALLDRPAARLLLAALARETAAVAVALGVQLPFDDPAAMVEDVARRTSSNYSSMVQDVKRGSPTEIDAICGAVVRAGQASGVPAPINWTMWQLVSALLAP